MSSQPWTINSEIYPLHLIGTASSLSATTNWLVNAIVAEVFKIVTDIGVGAAAGIYCSLGLFSIVTFIFTYYLIPETAEKPIGQILEEILGKDY